MKQTYVHAKPEFRGEIQEVDIPTPNDDQLVIKVVIAGSNPKDWKLPELGVPGNSGDDAAGYVYSVGRNVTEFKKGDRVAIFHEMTKPGGTFAEYALAWEHTTFHLPNGTSFEEGATIPLAAMTSAIGLFVNLRLPTPLLPATEPTPVLVYGASSAVGAFAIKLAKLANIHPIIGVAGSGGDFAKSIGCDVIVDYRKGNVAEDIKSALREHASGKQLLHVYDAISEHGSGEHINAVADQGAIVTHVLQNEKDYDSSKFTVIRTMVGDSHGKDAYRQDFAYAYYRLMSKWMKEGRFKPHPYEVVSGGLEAVVGGLMQLKEGKVSAKKLLFKVSDA
ncbi:hypothetical protein NliqN6_2333 [Naganishia liquefaciens]|uniref:Enoyl reductase (ER) domain-containing protein n=1 Tax=Naganishia liquefaciens TaxID=104408 RepID=A0A8H3YFP7_9TREE|nr:hypothetical protein NliqN6_2333 [Naganishia liquefaciens]